MRIEIRVRTAMATQAQLEGRFLGGRPPYGYRLADAGPYPNPAKAADGKRLHTLAIDDPAAAVVRRIFEEFTAGRGLYAIAERLTADGIASPSAHDPARNPHRCGIAWSKSAIRGILINPRYTGRQVWNRQRKDEVLIDVHDVALGHTKQDAVERGEQVDLLRRDRPSADHHHREVQPGSGHPRRTRAGTMRTQTTSRQARLRVRRAIFRGVCQRRMQGQWVNQAPYYRCRFLSEYALANKVDHPRNVYLREDAFGADVHDWLSGLFAPAELHNTIDIITAVQDSAVDDIAAESARARIADANQKMTRYRATIDAGGDLEEIGTWISQAKAQRLQAETDLRNATATSRLARHQIEDLITGIEDAAAMLTNAEPAQVADAYDKLGLRLTYDPGAQIVRATANPQPGNIGNWFVSEGRAHLKANGC